MSSQIDRLAERLSLSATTALMSAELNGLVWEIRDGNPAALVELEAEHHVIKRPAQWIVSRSGHKVREALRSRGLGAAETERRGLDM